MRPNPLNEHLEDEVILAYLDGELSRSITRKTRQHLQSCWKCRATAAEFELLVQKAIGLMASQSEADAHRARAAKDKFLACKAGIDAMRERRRTQGGILENQLALHAIVHGGLQKRFLPISM